MVGRITAMMLAAACLVTWAAPLPPLPPGAIRDTETVSLPMAGSPDVQSAQPLALGEGTIEARVEWLEPTQTELAQGTLSVAGPVLYLRALAPRGQHWHLFTSIDLKEWQSMGELETSDCYQVTTNEFVVPLWTLVQWQPAGQVTNQVDGTGWSWPAHGITNVPPARQYFMVGPK